MLYSSLSGVDFPRPAQPSGNIPIVLASDENYVPYLGVCMQSIAETGRTDRHYDFIVLETRITPDSKRRLAENLARFPHVSLRFFNPHELIAKVKFHTPSYYSEETYYRLFIQAIFQHYSKILYIDVDTIVTRDVSELYDTDVTNHLFAAALNAGTIPLVVANTNMEDYNWNDYLKGTLGLQDPYNYFQAGVLVCNVDAVRAFDLQAKALKKLGQIDPNFVDQDILNSVCDGRVKKLSLQWNFMDVFRHEFNNTHNVNMLKDEDRLDYMMAEENPFVVHYAGATSRPWYRPYIRYANLWWAVARRSLFYEEILFRNIARKNTQDMEHLLAATTGHVLANNHAVQRLNYIKYKILAKLTFGKRRRKYRQKKHALKHQLRRA